MHQRQIDRWMDRLAAASCSLQVACGVSESLRRAPGISIIPGSFPHGLFFFKKKRKKITLRASWLKRMVIDISLPVYGFSE
jgi:hypothetical protein